METVPHISALQLGRPYESLDGFEAGDHRTGAITAAVSAVNAGIIRKAGEAVRDGPLPPGHCFVRFLCAPAGKSQISFSVRQSCPGAPRGDAETNRPIARRNCDNE
ncbi:MAG TPA: hypothetical protein VN887_09175 [Candidatus Angelobacter sp.]|nr:hypothetical protein [Candidatus Angelobacter sp.]